MPQPPVAPQFLSVGPRWAGRPGWTFLRRALSGAPCAVCRSWSATTICTDCLARFDTAVARCRRCACEVPMGVGQFGAQFGAQSGAQWGIQCGACLHHPPPFTATVAAFDYGFPWDHLIGAFKYGARLDLAAALAGFLAERVQAAAGAEGIDLVTAVPLSPSRLRERGYNQAWEIARRVAPTLRRPARHDLLLRLRDTATQTRLDRPQRAANLRGAFMPGPGLRPVLTGRRIALVDDVMTTGATAHEAARTLLQGGAAEVHLWLLARTEPRPGPPR